MNLAANALRRPVTVCVLVMGVMLSAFLAARQMPRDIFPGLLLVNLLLLLLAKPLREYEQE